LISGINSGPENKEYTL
jgi:hypothetical protein